MKLKRFLVPPDVKVRLKDYPTDDTHPYEGKEAAAEKLAADIESLGEWQSKLYADDRYALLVILQGMDAAGKDGTIKHVLSGINPTGCRVSSFKAPSNEELDHDFLWRFENRMPERGQIGIFNRSYYEEVLVVRVHPELLGRQKLPRTKKGDDIWNDRFRQINQYEEYLVDNGVEILKIFLNLSKAEQKNRFLGRLDDPEKHWKFNAADVAERAYWKQYQDVYEQMLSNTSTEKAPWHIVPADKKWFTHATVAELMIRKFEAMKLDYPKIKGDLKKELEKARLLLKKEK